jgi:hypothetical protein
MMKAVLRVATMLPLLALFKVLVAIWAARQVAKGTVTAGTKGVSAIKTMHAWLVPDLVKAQHDAAVASCAAIRAEYLQGYAAAQSTTHTTISPEKISTSGDLWVMHST